MYPPNGVEVDFSVLFGHVECNSSGGCSTNACASGEQDVKTNVVVVVKAICIAILFLQVVTDGEKDAHRILFQFLLLRWSAQNR